MIEVDGGWSWGSLDGASSAAARASLGLGGEGGRALGAGLVVVVDELHDDVFLSLIAQRD